MNLFPLLPEVAAAGAGTAAFAVLFHVPAAFYLRCGIIGGCGWLCYRLLMAAGLGLAFCVLAFVGIMIVVVRALMFGDPTSGWPSLVCIILLCSGVQLLCTGIAGEYLAKTYLETKHRPIYIAAETEEDLDAE